MTDRRTSRLFHLQQDLERRELRDTLAALRLELLRLEPLVAPGARIAIACGSRGIDTYAAVVKEVSAFVRARGALPFIVPAMGSHGGATAEGQRDVLRRYGITEDAMNAPVCATMDVAELPRGALPHRIFMDRFAWDSDGVILVNRIKPHTDFHARYESGLMKMAAIGLGKREGAAAIHDFGVTGLRELIGPAAEAVLATGKILAGVALVENAVHKTMMIRVLKAAEIAGEEPALLDAARQSMPALPTRLVDVLVVDRMGKDISGVGIDPNITGRVGVSGQHGFAGTEVRMMVVTDLTAASRGNAIGVGLADVITRRLFDKIDWRETYANVVTSGFLERGKLPIVAEDDREAFGIALRGCGGLRPGAGRIVRLLDTLHLETLYVSEPIAAELRGSSRCTVADTAIEMFDAAGRLLPF